MARDDKKARLTRASVELAQRHGLTGFAIADAAAAADVPAGGVYYHFRTKEDMQIAAVESRRAAVGILLEEWATQGDARAALTRLVDWFETSPALTPADLAREAGRAGDAVRDAAAAFAEDVLAWTAARFAEIGYAAPAARARATHLLAGLEGALIVSVATASPDTLATECAHLRRWVERA